VPHSAPRFQRLDISYQSATTRLQAYLRYRDDTPKPRAAQFPRWVGARAAEDAEAPEDAEIDCEARPDSEAPNSWPLEAPHSPERAKVNRIPDMRRWGAARAQLVPLARRAGDDQSAAGCRASHRLRGGGCRTAQSGTGGRHSSREGRAGSRPTKDDACSTRTPPRCASDATTPWSPC
jgi:hypothetical protein